LRRVFAWFDGNGNSNALSAKLQSSHDLFRTTY
jgi:hypothetical protein